MFLYLVRHAIAIPRGAPSISSDAARELTPEGIRRMRQNARALVQLHVFVEEVWTSPLIRARQTADLLAEELIPRPSVRVVQALQPEGDFDLLISELDQCLERAGIALVGHEPDLGEFATFLLAGLRSPALQIKKGGVAFIQAHKFTPPMRNRLRWLLTPKQLRMIL